MTLCMRSDKPKSQLSYIDGFKRRSDLSYVKHSRNCTTWRSRLDLAISTTRGVLMLQFTFCERGKCHSNFTVAKRLSHCFLKIQTVTSACIRAAGVSDLLS